MIFHRCPPARRFLLPSKAVLLSSRFFSLPSDLFLPYHFLQSPFPSPASLLPCCPWPRAKAGGGGAAILPNSESPPLLPAAPRQSRWRRRCLHNPSLSLSPRPCTVFTFAMDALAADTDAEVDQESPLGMSICSCLY
jgi:hypothetical protein